VFDYLGFGKEEQGGFLPSDESALPMSSTNQYSSSFNNNNSYVPTQDTLLPVHLNTIAKAHSDNPSATDLYIPFPLGKSTPVGLIQVVGYVYDFVDNEDETSLKNKFTLCDGTSAIEVFWHVGASGSLSRHRETEIQNIYKKCQNKNIYVMVIGEVDLRGVLSSSLAIKANTVIDISDNLDLIMYHDVECLNVLMGGDLLKPDPFAVEKREPVVHTTPLRSAQNTQQRSESQNRGSFHMDVDKAENSAPRSIRQTNLRGSIKSDDLPETILSLLKQYGADRPDGVNVREIQKVLNSRNSSQLPLESIRKALEVLDDEGSAYSTKSKDYWVSSE